MSLRPRFMVSSLTMAAVLGGSGWTARPAEAGFLCDWLFGRTAPAYVAGYAPAVPVAGTAPASYAAGYAPYVAGYAPAPTYAPATNAYAPYVAGYAPTAPTGAPYVAGYAPAVAPTAGAYPAAALQQPSYPTAVGVYDNPSVYTGRPVVMAPGSTTNLPLTTALRPSLAQPFAGLPSSAPLATTIRGNETAAGSFYGTGNLYPDASANATYQAAYAAAYPNTTGVVGATATTLPVTPVAPAFTTVPAQPQGGLARFFGSLFGTRYTSSYYRAPITYYRPVNTIDPATGAAVTVQQPCSSYVQQLQRTPYASHLAPAAPIVAPTTIAPTYSTPTYDPNACQPNLGGSAVPLSGNSTLAPSYNGSSVAPVTGYSELNNGFAAPTDRSVVPIPSIAPPALNPPSYAPYTGDAPAPLSGSTSVGGNGDRAPVTQPQLEAARPSIPFTPSSENPDRYPPAGGSGSSYNSETTSPATPMWRRESTYENKSAQLDQSSDETTAVDDTTPDPIPAPQNYRSRDALDAYAQRTGSVDRPSTTPVASTPVTSTLDRWDAAAPPSTDRSSTDRSITLEAPPLPPATKRDLGERLPPLPPASFSPPSISTSDMQLRSRTPAREASLPTELRRPAPAPIQQPTETGWFPIP